MEGQKRQHSFDLGGQVKLAADVYMHRGADCRNGAGRLGGLRQPEQIRALLPRGRAQAEPQTRHGRRAEGPPKSAPRLGAAPAGAGRGLRASGADPQEDEREGPLLRPEGLRSAFAAVSVRVGRDHGKEARPRQPAHLRASLGRANRHVPRRRHRGGLRRRHDGGLGPPRSLHRILRHGRPQREAGRPDAAHGGRRRPTPRLRAYAGMHPVLLVRDEEYQCGALAW
mmetsp:Transcript_70716/g.178997  ORF Transcript_70716/g.178997 Transcript_70716/m.178997 type:complete len:226 (+) Transcript_70716:569-1246(+)